MWYFYIIFYSFTLCSAVKRSVSLTVKKKKSKTPQKTKKRTLQTCNINKAVSVLFGNVVNPGAITYVLGEVINPYAIADVLSITQTGQTSECNVEEYSIFMQK